MSTLCERAMAPMRLAVRGPRHRAGPPLQPGHSKTPVHCLVKRPRRRDGRRAMNIDPTASRLAPQGVAYAPQIAPAARRHGSTPTCWPRWPLKKPAARAATPAATSSATAATATDCSKSTTAGTPLPQTPGGDGPGRRTPTMPPGCSRAARQYGGNVHGRFRPTTPAARTPPAPQPSGGRADPRLCRLRPGALPADRRATARHPPGRACRAGCAGGLPKPAIRRNRPSPKSARCSPRSACSGNRRRSRCPSLPSPPQPSLQPQTYHPQVTDYAGLLGRRRR